MQNRIRERILSVFLLFCMILSIYGTMFYVSEHAVHHYHCTADHCSVCMQLKEGASYLERFASSNVEPFFDGLSPFLLHAHMQKAYLNSDFSEKSLVLLSIRMNC